MPDLTTEYYYYCESIDGFRTEIGQYVVRHTRYAGWDCTCKGWKYRKNCKHVAQAKEKFCGWHQFTSPEPLDDLSKELGVCPKCKAADIQSEGWAV